MVLKTLAHFLVSSAFLVVVQARCPTGAVQGTAANDCYTLVSSPSGWYDAEETCVQRGGHLASITSGFVNAFVRLQASDRQWQSDYWLGGSNDQGSWTWSDGVPFKYQAWAKGQPSKGDSLCLSAKSLTGQWYASSCFGVKPFVCKLPAIAEQNCPKPTPTPSGTCPPCHCDENTPTTVAQTTRSAVATCEDGWKYSSVTNLCYWVIDADRRGEWGQEVCDTVSAEIVSIHSAAENEAALNAALAATGSGYVGVTIGLSYNASKMTWADGSPVDYTHFATNGKFKHCSGNNCMTVLELRKPEPGTASGDWIGYDVQSWYSALCVKPPSVQ